MVFRRIRSAFRLIVSFFDYSLSAYAGQVTCFFMISAFPLAVLLISLIGQVPGWDRGVLEQLLRPILPDSLLPTIDRWLMELYSTKGITLLSVTAVTTLWAASKGFHALIRGLNRVYGCRETRNYFVRRGLAILYTLAMPAALAATLLLLVFGNRIAAEMQTLWPRLNQTALLLTTYRWLVVLVLLTALFLSLYLLAPCRKSRLKRELPGAVFSAAGWIAFSDLYARYLQFAAPNVYGSLSAPVFLMLWLYACIYILFLGGKLNGLITAVTLAEK